MTYAEMEVVLRLPPTRDLQYTAESLRKWRHWPSIGQCDLPSCAGRRTPRDRVNKADPQGGPSLIRLGIGFVVEMSR